ncbi:hypothetical protein GCM10009430_48390 [Aquimarina litoralis]|uniref:Uncharacterized protein n=1 Tax=Aquimarina litoralis TaxID=584605 RepID=A0ABN1JAF7_9FLAO
MIEYEVIINHLVNNACVAMEEGDYEEGTFYQNLNNFEVCHVPKEDELDEIACCDIFFELQIDPIEGLEEEFERFVEFRRSLTVPRN